MENIICKIKAHFDSKSVYFLLFSMHDSRVESWFKGELIYLFFLLKQAGEILDYETEFPSDDGKRIDFHISLPNGELILLELKALSISQLKNNRSLSFYFRDTHIFKDFRKLDKVTCGYNKYAIAFIYPKPKEISWSSILSNMEISFNNWACFTNLSDYGESYYMSAWKWK